MIRAMTRMRNLEPPSPRIELDVCWKEAGLSGR